MTDEAKKLLREARVELGDFLNEYRDRMKEQHWMAGTEFLAEIDSFLSRPEPAAPEPVATLICPKCGVDRFKQPCGNATHILTCPMQGVALAAPPQAQSAAPQDQSAEKDGTNCPPVVADARWRP